MNDRPLATPGVDRARVERAVIELLEAIGEDPQRSELVSTPQRVADSYAEFFSGVGVDALAILDETFPVPKTQGTDPVIIRDLSFRSMCEHHLLPFEGVAHVAYLPKEKVAGLGRFSTLIDVLASRPQLQERLSEQIAEAIEQALAPRGVLVVLDARHSCVTARGARQSSSSTVTITSRGELAEPASRAEIMALIGGS